MIPNITCEKRYALRAVFELAKRRGGGPVKVSEIAAAQAIPARFLEVILSKLKRIGILNSKRGYQGGYTLGRLPCEITVSCVFESLEVSSCQSGTGVCAEGSKCPFSSRCVFLPLWERVRTSVNEVYSRTTIQDLLDSETALPVK